jgi:putative oxidoreductase
MFENRSSRLGPVIQNQLTAAFSGMVSAALALSVGHLFRRGSMLASQTARRGWALLPLRLVIGFGFAAHGYAKLHRGPDKFAAILASIGVPQPHLTAWVTALLEFFGGISLMAGAFVLPLTVPLAVIMLTAIFTVHLRYGFSSVVLKGVTSSGAQFGPVGYELNLLYIAGLLTLAINGAGALSIDAWLEGSKLRSDCCTINAGPE